MPSFVTPLKLPADCNTDGPQLTPKVLDNFDSNISDSTNDCPKDISNSVDAPISKDPPVVKDDITPSQSSIVSTRHVLLSQPPRMLTQKQRLIWLQERREVGLWVQCCRETCNKWRYLKHVHDPLQLPDVWYCEMNTGSSANSCSVREIPLNAVEVEDLVHGQYSCGSLVWARMPSYPPWPAMVDDCPDTEQYYWLNGFSDIPTYYNVTFFDSADVTRHWILTGNLTPYHNADGVKLPPKKEVKVTKAFQGRMAAAIKQADHAMTLSIANRLKTYSFTTRFKGKINYPIESESSSDDDSGDEDYSVTQNNNIRPSRKDSSGPSGAVDLPSASPGPIFKSDENIDEPMDL